LVAAAPVAAPAPAPANGSIFQAAAYRPMFEDYRARLPGDTLTINIVEKINASQSSTSSVDKGGTVSAGLSAFPFLKAPTLAKLNAAGTSSNAFEGTGTTESINQFSGTITATVTGVLPNGHLLVVGEKQIGVNANVDVLRFSGQVDPRAIRNGNAVPSAQVANVRLEQRSNGQQGEAQVIGWLARFFLSVLPI
jgi:flagellar L-ring protein precursor FlgH